MNDTTRTRPRGGSHLMSRALGKRFQEFRDSGNAQVMEGLEALPPDQCEVRYKGSDIENSDPPKRQKQKPVYKRNKDSD